MVVSNSASQGHQNEILYVDGGTHEQKWFNLEDTKQEAKKIEQDDNIEHQ